MFDFRTNLKARSMLFKMFQVKWSGYRDAPMLVIFAAMAVALGKKWISRFGLVGLLLSFVHVAAADDAGRCYAIRDHDLRAACLAQARNSASGCYAINNADRRALCLAERSESKSRCYSIRDLDLRNACLAEMSR